MNATEKRKAIAEECAARGVTLEKFDGRRHMAWIKLEGGRTICGEFWYGMSRDQVGRTVEFEIGSYDRRTP